MMQIDYYVAYAEAREIFDAVSDKRAVEKRNGGLGAVFCERPKPGAESCCKYKCFHLCTVTSDGKNEY
jgi:hypothetical protein